MVDLIQSENHTANKGKTAGRYQFDTDTPPTGIGLIFIKILNNFIHKIFNIQKSILN